MIIKNNNKRGKRTICTCLQCGQEFSELNTKIKHGEGKFCSNECYLKYRKDNKKNSKELNCLYQKKNKYGLNESEYKYLFIKQNNKCAICGTEFNEKLKGFVDHNHQTKKVRGLLCTHCNSLLGFAKDSIDILNNAITYLNNNQ